MNRRSAKKRSVRKAANEVRRSSSSELARLASRMAQPVETSEIPERTGPSNRVVRDSGGKIIRPQESLLRSAILAEVKRRGISGHHLWRKAREYCLTLPESAVYEFLSGRRQVGLAYLDAMLEALGLSIARPR